MTSINILEGDCLEMMDLISSGTVNLAFTSPPYGNQRKEQYGGIDPDIYIEWFLPRAEKVARVLTSDGSFVVNIKEAAKDGQMQRYVYELVLAMRDAGWWLVDEFIWHKSNIFPHPSPNRLDNSYERVYHFTRGKGHAFYKDAVKVVTKDIDRVGETKKARVSATGSGNYLTKPAVLRKMVYPRNVLTGPTHVTSGWHPAIMPKWLADFFINLMTVDGDTVLDPFAGSGTTLFSAYSLGRNAIGCEMHPEYCSKIKQSISKLNLRLPLDYGN